MDSSEVVDSELRGDYVAADYDVIGLILEDFVGNHVDEGAGGSGAIIRRVSASGAEDEAGEKGSCPLAPRGG